MPRRLARPINAWAPVRSWVTVPGADSSPIRKHLEPAPERAFDRQPAERVDHAVPEQCVGGVGRQRDPRLHLEPAVGTDPGVARLAGAKRRGWGVDLVGLEVDGVQAVQRQAPARLVVAQYRSGRPRPCARRAPARCRPPDGAPVGNEPAPAETITSASID